MKRIITFFIVILFVCSFVTLADATMYSFVPGDPDLDDLDHYYYYTWGIDFELPAGETIVGATLEFHNIRNWDNNPNDLYVHLLDSAVSGVIKSWDNQGGGDNFAGQGILLGHWEDLTTTPQDIIYPFTSDQIYSLISYVSDDNFGLGFDPDCHYWNDHVQLKITTEQTAIPEPSTMLLLGGGLLGLGAFRKKFEK